MRVLGSVKTKITIALFMFAGMNPSNALAERNASYDFKGHSTDIISSIQPTQEFVDWCAINKSLIRIVKISEEDVIRLNAELRNPNMNEDIEKQLIKRIQRVEETARDGVEQLNRVKDIETVRIGFILPKETVFLLSDDTLQTRFGKVYIERTGQFLTIFLYGSDICEFSEVEDNGSSKITKSGVIGFLNSLGSSRFNLNELK